MTCGIQTEVLSFSLCKGFRNETELDTNLRDR